MTAGSLPGFQAEAPRKRGRPKGATAKRAKDFKGYVDATFGGSTAQQSARFCMITPKDLREAGGSMGQAQVNKALDLVRKVRDAQAALDGDLQAAVLGALEALIAARPTLDAKELRQFVAGFIGRVKAAGGEFTLAQALKLHTDERAALLPYTDQKQPLAVTMEGNGPSVVVMAGDPVAFAQVSMGGEGDADFIEVFEGEAVQVSRGKSHEDQQTLALPGLEPPSRAD